MGRQKEAPTEVESLRQRVGQLEKELEESRRREQTLVERVRSATALESTNAQLRERAAELDAARRSAEASSQARANFLAHMSHEIRTPMTAIIGFAELLEELHERHTHEDFGFGQESRRHITMIRTCGMQLLNLINDILDISKIERRSLRLQEGTVRLDDVLREVVDVMQAAASEKGIMLRLQCQTPLPERVHTDKNALTRVLMNLVGNAVKFTQEGSVSVEAALEKTSGDARVHVSVQDTGIGIAPEHLGSLFVPFYQVDSTNPWMGSGLGLTISRELVRLLGGELRVESRVGEGSRFSFWLPISDQDARVLTRLDGEAQTTAATDGRASAGGELPYRILVAEDVETNRILIERMLKKAGAEVACVKDGGMAMTMALDGARRGAPFDIILMDMLMPVMDGYEATRRLREKGYQGAIIALTASAMGSDKTRCLDAGCNDFATKPINRAELYAVIRRHAEGARRQRAHGQDRRSEARP